MIDVHQAAHDELRRIAAAGAEGLPLADVCTAAAVTLGLEGLVRITRDAPQRVSVTDLGAAFLRRLAFA